MRQSARDDDIEMMVNRYGMVSSGQMRRAIFTTGTENGRAVRCRRALLRLTKRGRIKRIRSRGVLGGPGGSEGYYYQPVAKKAHAVDEHTYAITELHVRLVEAGHVHEYYPDPEASIDYHGIVIEPDAHIFIGGRQWYVEVDMGSETVELRGKMKRYAALYEEWPKDQVFPKVIFIVMEDRSAGLIRRYIDALDEDYHQLFTIVSWEDAAAALIA